MEEPTYRAYERDPDTSSKGNSQTLHRYARRLSKLLDVRYEWLLDGDGAPFLDASDRAKAIVDGIPADKQDAFVDAIASMAKAANG